MKLRILSISAAAMLAAGCLFDGGGADPASLAGFPPQRTQTTWEFGPFAPDSVWRGTDSMPSINPTRLALGDRDGLSHEVFLEFRTDNAANLKLWQQADSAHVRLLMAEDSSFFGNTGFTSAWPDSGSLVPILLNTTVELGTEWDATADTTWAKEWLDTIRTGQAPKLSLPTSPLRGHGAKDSLWLRLPDSLFSAITDADSLNAARVRMRLSTDDYGKVLRLVGAGYALLPRLVFTWLDTADSVHVWTLSAWKIAHAGIRTNTGSNPLQLQAGIRESIQVTLPDWLADSLLGAAAGQGMQLERRVLAAEIRFPFNSNARIPESDMHVPLLTFSYHDSIESVGYLGGTFAEAYRVDTAAVVAQGHPYLLGKRDTVSLQVTGTLAHIVSTGGSAKPVLRLRLGVPSRLPNDFHANNYYSTDGDVVLVNSDQPEFGRYDLSVLAGANMSIRILTIDGVVP